MRNIEYRVVATVVLVGASVDGMAQARRDELQGIRLGYLEVKIVLGR